MKPGLRIYAADEIWEDGPDFNELVYEFTFNDNSPAADTITRAAGSFVTDGFSNGDTIKVSGSASNDGTYEINTVAALTLTLVAAGTLTNETIECVINWPLNKAELTLTEVQNGFRSSEVIAPDTWNMWRWKVSQLMQNAAAIAPMTITEGDKSGLQTIADAAYNYRGQVVGAYCPVNKRHTLISCNTGGATEYTREFWADGHHLWTSDASAGSTQGSTIDYGAPAAGEVQWIPSGGNALPTTHPGSPGGFSVALNVIGFDDNREGIRVVTTTDFGGFYHSTNFGNWTYWTGSYDIVAPGVVGADWGQVRSDGNGRWVFHNATDNLLYYADSLGAIPTQIASPTATGNVRSILEHTRHQPGDLHPDDPGNAVWLFIGGALGAGSLLRSFDGINWLTFSPVSPSGTSLSLTPLREKCLRYSKYGARWCLLGSDTSGATDVPTIIYSDDDGDTWEEVSDAFGLGGESLDKTDCGDANIETDGYGTWMVAIQVYAEEQQTRHYVSVDNALTWKRVFPFVGNSTYAANSGRISTVMGSALWYGQGRFNFFLLGQLDQTSVNCTFADNTPNRDTITRASGSFLDEGYSRGQIITVAGTALNNGSYTVSEVAATVLTITLGGTLVAEGPVATTITRPFIQQPMSSLGVID